MPRTTAVKTKPVREALLRVFLPLAVAVCCCRDFFNFACAHSDVAGGGTSGPFYRGGRGGASGRYDDTYGRPPPETAGDNVGDGRRQRQPPYYDGPSQPPLPPRQPPPPQQQEQEPPPPQGAYNPIHYEFKSRDASSAPPGKGGRPGSGGDGGGGDIDDGVPVTYVDERQRVGWPDDDDGRERGEIPARASPRRDAVTRQMSTARGRLSLRSASTAVGAGLGAFLGKSLFGHAPAFAYAFAALFFACTYFRNPYGEWVRALGLTLVYTLQRSRRVRKTYPTWVHVKSSVGVAERLPFPPGTSNPWTYRPSDFDDEYGRAVDFNMMYAIAAMAFVGSTCGGNLPMIPAWMGALGGAVFFAFVTTLNNPRGDLARTMGMRVVAVLMEVWEINRELRVLNKTAVVSGKLLDKALILDRKHRIKDRVVSGVTFLYEQILRAANQMPSRSNVDDEGGQYGPRRRGREPPPPLFDEDRRGRSPPPEGDRYRRGGPPLKRRPEGANDDRYGRPPPEDRPRR